MCRLKDYCALLKLKKKKKNLAYFQIKGNNHAIFRGEKKRCSLLPLPLRTFFFSTFLHLDKQFRTALSPFSLSPPFTPHTHSLSPSLLALFLTHKHTQIPNTPSLSFSLHTHTVANFDTCVRPKNGDRLAPTSTNELTHVHTDRSTARH